MLNVVHSNRLEVLADVLAGALRESPRGPLQPHTIIVQSSGMARWLSFALAERLGVAANLRFEFPARYLWSLFSAVLPEVPAQSPFEPTVLTWQFMAALQSDPAVRRHPRVLRYLGEEDDPRRRHALAARLATVYDRYLVYRPHWIAAWDENRLLGLGEDEAWQAALWRAATAAQDTLPAQHPRELFYAALEQDASARSRLPPTLDLYAISALPPLYMDVFQRLAAHVEVRLYLLNPCREYWGEIVRRRALAREAAEDADAAAYLETGNSLLASMGAHGRHFYDAIAATPAATHELYVPREEDSLLALVQNDILFLRERGNGEDEVPPATLAADDVSLQVHRCHSAMREVEVLHDRLLAAFEQDPSLQPGDVLVLIPRIDAYAPAIDAVFATAPLGRRLPYAIADLGMERDGGIVRLFLRLLRLPESRLEAEFVLGLLEEPLIARRFNLSAAELPLLRQWVRETGIRWGRDAAARQALGLPATAEHSWEAGLARLLLGYALPGEDEQLYRALLPYDDIEGGAAQALGSLHSFVDALHELADELREARPLSQWQRVAERLLSQLFEIDDSDEHAAQAVRSAAATLAANAAHARFDEAVPLEVWREELEALLEPGAEGSAFLNGGITFAALRPGRPIPARFIALLGLNDGDFPRQQAVAGFDLCAVHPQRGDRQPRDEDRYAFLEALLAAGDHLHLSYTGRSQRDNSELAASPLLAELLDVVNRSVELADGGKVLPHIVVDHPLQPFSQRYFDGGDDRLYSYAEDYAAASRASAAARQPRPFMTQPLPTSEPRDLVDLGTLERFVRHPARHFLQERLGIALETAITALDDHEPFSLDGLETFDLRQSLLLHAANGLDAEASLERARASGKLPHGSPGEVLHARAWEEIVPLHAAQTAAGSLERVTLNLECNGIRLTGTVDGVGKAERLVLHPATLRPPHLLKHWVAHLALNAAGHAVSSLIVGTDRQLRFAPVDDPAAHLAVLMQWLQQGDDRALPFFPQAGWAYVEALDKAGADPYAAALQVWRGGSFRRGECEDEWFALAFRGQDTPLGEEFATLSCAFYTPLREALHD